MPVCDPVTVICSTFPTLRAAATAPPLRSRPGATATLPGDGVFPLKCGGLLASLPLASSGRADPPGTGPRSDPVTTTGRDDAAAPDTVTGTEPPLPNSADHEPKNAKKPLTNARTAASTRTWLAAIRPSLDAIIAGRWRPANRGHSQTVAATEPRAAAIISPMKNPLVSPVNPMSLAPHAVPCRQLRKQPHVVSSASSPMSSAPHSRGLKRAADPVEDAGQLPLAEWQAGLADVHRRAGGADEGLPGAAAGEQHRDRLHGLVLQQPGQVILGTDLRAAAGLGAAGRRGVAARRHGRHREGLRACHRELERAVSAR